MQRKTVLIDENAFNDLRLFCSLFNERMGSYVSNLIKNDEKIQSSLKKIRKMRFNYED